MSAERVERIEVLETQVGTLNRQIDYLIEQFREVLGPDVASIKSLVADAYRAEGQPVPPQFADAAPLPEGSRPRDRRPARERAAALGWGQARVRSS